MSNIQSFTPLWGVWEIESDIGEGSFGKVYKAVRKEYGRTYYCAIKHIPLPQNEAEVKQFLDEQVTDDRSVASDYYRQIVEGIMGEIDVMHKLRGNTNIVSYEDHMIRPRDDGVGYDIFIRMELLTEFQARLKEAAFTQAEAVKLGIDICTALEVCVARNLLHRDIKPQNIFISEDGNYKLGDFGIARKLEKTTGGLSKKGTFFYMAPEVYKGQEYGASVDIYSLGIVLYRILNGNRLPFLPPAPSPVRYDDNEKALARRMNGEAMPIPAFADVSLANIILKMCAFDRKKRYQTAGEVKHDLQLVADTLSKTTMATESPAPQLVSQPVPQPQPKPIQIEDEPTDGTILILQNVQQPNPSVPPPNVPPPNIPPPNMPPPWQQPPRPYAWQRYAPQQQPHNPNVPPPNIPPQWQQQPQQPLQQAGMIYPQPITAPFQNGVICPRCGCPAKKHTKAWRWAATVTVYGAVNHLFNHTYKCPNCKFIWVYSRSGYNN